MQIISPNTEELINGMREERTDNFENDITLLRRFLLRCESPIEQMLIVALFERSDGMIVNEHLQRIQQTAFGGMGSSGLFTLVIEIQKTISLFVADQDYRADLFIYLTRWWWGGGEQAKWGKIIVEVDGHDYHERTKEQAARDRQRDRDLMLDGYKVIRFTGSEIYNNHSKCAEDLLLILENEADDTFRSYRSAGRLEELLTGP
jgi:hypothetical protein